MSNNDLKEPVADAPPSEETKQIRKAQTKTKSKASPLAPASFPAMAQVDGVDIAAVDAKLYPKKRRDLAVFRLPPGSAVAGVFTQSKTASPAVGWCRAQLERPDAQARAIVVNAGNANAFCGRAGEETVRRTVAAAAAAIGCRQRDVFVASTGVIGEPMTAEKIETGITEAIEGFGGRKWRAAARAIMTTDTFPKGATAVAHIDGVPVRINAIAKGSGMIAPDMATMLAFVFTDAAIPSPVLQSLLTINVRDTFNAITVDSDTSTSDTVLLCATGQADHAPVTRAGDRRLSDFRNALHAVMLDLAHQIVRDGEGATKFAGITVTGAETIRAAKRIALAIGNSPLVKTALAGEDPNWGRIVMAVGKSGEAADRDKMSIWFGPYKVAESGAVAPSYTEASGAAYFKRSELDIRVDVGVGEAAATIWTCDLTHGYVSINADYRS